MLAVLTVRFFPNSAGTPSKAGGLPRRSLWQDDLGARMGQSQAFGFHRFLIA